MPRKKKIETGEEKVVEEKEKKIKGEKTQKEKVKKETIEVEKVEEKLLVPLDDYIKTAIHFGTKAITPGMRPYVYKRRADGIAVLNTKKIDEKIAIAASFLAQYNAEDIMICCRREAGYKALEAFGAALKAHIFKRYPAGLITNPQLENFFEPKVVIVIDPWLDKNALLDAVKIRVPIVALCDTNNPTEFVDFIIPCNNKTSKSIGLVLYLLAKLYLEKRKIKIKLNQDDFYSSLDSQE